MRHGTSGLLCNAGRQMHDNGEGPTCRSQPQARQSSCRKMRQADTPSMPAAMVPSPYHWRSRLLCFRPVVMKSL